MYDLDLVNDEALAHCGAVVPKTGKHTSSLVNALFGLCGLVVRVSGYRYRGPGFDPRRYQIF